MGEGAVEPQPYSPTFSRSAPSSRSAAPRGLGPLPWAPGSPIGIVQHDQIVSAKSLSFFAKAPCCTVAVPVSRLIDVQKAIANHPSAYCNIVEQHGGSTESHTLTPKRWYCHKWGGWSFQAESPRKISITRGKSGMSLMDETSDHVMDCHRVMCLFRLMEALARLFRSSP